MVGRELPSEHDSLRMSLRGERALAQLGPLTTPRLAGPYRRVLVTSKLSACDCYGGLALRACIVLHLSAHPENRAQIWEPKDPGVWSRMHDLLSPLPAGCELAEDHPRPARNREIVVPAMRIEGPETAELLGHTIARVHAGLGVDVSAARAVAGALVALAENAREHAADSSVGVMVACALERPTNELQIVALDVGGTFAKAADPPTQLRDALARSRAQLGGLASLVLLAERRGIDATLRLASGPARARWRAGERVRYEEGATVPGFIASFSVRL
jgi:hypothetical protein